MRPIVIATRRSELALWQARHVAGLLASVQPALNSQLLPLASSGDLLLDQPLAEIGGKGLFVKEIEQAVRDGRADLAVHSLKDLPSLCGEGLMIGAFIKRQTWRDVFLSVKYADPQALPPGAKVGSSSLRRQAQFLALRPDVQIVSLRGNVQTRLDKLLRGEYDAIILAEAGLQRLGLGAPHLYPLDVDCFLPALGQGVLAVQIRADDPDLAELCAQINDPATQICSRAEWALLEALQGGCRLPVGGLATLEADRIIFTGMVARPDGSLILRESVQGPAAKPEMTGRILAEVLVTYGAGEIIEALLQGQA